MGRPRILDEKLMTKLARKLRKKSLVPINKMVSARARRDRVSAPAALVLIAQEHKIGTATYLGRLDAAKQAEVRQGASAPLPLVGATAKARGKRSGNAGPTEMAKLKAVIEYLLQDTELQERCTDLLMAKRYFDRPINQATLILEDRIRKKSLPPQRLVGEQLVGYAFNEDLARTVLQVPGGELEDQRGFTQMLRGIVPAFRNKTHHHIVKTFSREDAMRVCGFIDVLLRVVDGSTKAR